MRIVFFCFPIIGFQMVTTNFFQSIGMAGKAIFLSLSRQLLFLMPGLIFLPRIFDELTPWDGSWGVVVFDAAVGFPGFAGCRCHAVLPIPEVQGQGRCGERRGFGSRSRKRSQSE